VQLNPLTAIAPIDGRYYSTTKPLSPYFSEYALIQYRIRVEVEYFIALTEFRLPELAAFPKEKLPLLRSLYQNFSESAVAVPKFQRIRGSRNQGDRKEDQSRR